jgi:general stress protein 26
MKIALQSSPDRRQLSELIKPIRVAMLTTLADGGALMSRPMSPLEMDGSGSLWFFTDTRSTKLDQSGVVNLAFADQSSATYVSISGRGLELTDRVKIKELWTALAKPWFPDGPDSIHLALLKVVPDIAEYWDAPHSKMVRMLGMAASVVAGKPVLMGEHEVLTALSKP